MSFIDYWIYFTCYRSFSYAYEHQFYYGPGFWLWFYPLRFLHPYAYIGLLLFSLWLLGIVLYTQKVPIWLNITIIMLCISSMATANLDVILTLFIVTWEPYRKKNPFLTGLLLGFCCFKPICFILIIWFYPRNNPKPFFLGLSLMLILNYGYFLFDIPALMIFLQNITLSNHPAGPTWLIPIHYGWFIYYFGRSHLKYKQLTSFLIPFYVFLNWTALYVTIILI